MLGKLIKNEFINRGKTVLLQIGGLFVFSIVVALLWSIHDAGVENDFFMFFLGMATVAFGIVEFVVVISLLTGSVKDFGDRLFKDQGYLTHTLPVKTSSIILARMVFDIAIIIVISIIVPISAGIASRDIDVIRRFFIFVEVFIEAMNTETLWGAGVAFNIVLSLVMFLLGALSTMWLFNVSYAIGHSFNKSKRVMSVVAFFAVGFLTWIFYYIFGYTLTESSMVRSCFDTSYVKGVTALLLIACFCISVSVVVYAIITSHICKKRLNIE